MIFICLGPMQPGLTPREASDRLQMFQNHFDALWRKHSSYTIGEDLFGLPHSEQPELNKIKKELNLLQRLYKLYNDVIDSVNNYHNIPWAEVNIEDINNELLEFQNRCRKLPKGLKVSSTYLQSILFNLYTNYLFSWGKLGMACFPCLEENHR